MTRLHARFVLALSIAVLLALGCAWAWWPERARADLRTVRPLVTTTSTSVPPSSAATATTQAATTTSSPAPPSDPTRLRIPALGVNAVIVPVGLARDGQMEIPTAAQVGWYDLGPRPGDQGSAVLAAHVDYDGQEGAFFDLASIPVGAEVLVDEPSGTRRFVVTRRDQIAKADIDLSSYFTADGPTRVTLITCGGSFSHSTGHYEDNLVITAEPAP